MAGDFFAALGAVVGAAGTAGVALVVASELICGLASVTAPGIVTLFGSAIGRAFAAGLPSSSGLRDANAAGRGRGSGGVSGRAERDAERGATGRTRPGSMSAVLGTVVGASSSAGS